MSLATPQKPTACLALADGTLFYGTVGAILCEVVLGLHDIRYTIAVTHYKVVGLRWPVRHRFEIVDIHAADMNLDTERGV